jgi:hypothetical protein
MTDDFEKTQKLKDIREIHFGNELQEITSSLELLMTLFEIQDDREILSILKEKISEGIAKLKNLNLPIPGNFEK